MPETFNQEEFRSNELSRRQTSDVQPTQTEAERQEEERILNDVMQNLHKFSGSLPALRMQSGAHGQSLAEAADLIQKLCAVQETILEEQRAALNPDLRPQKTMAGKPYSYRGEALAGLRGAMRHLEPRDIHTIDVQPED